MIAITLLLVILVLCCLSDIFYRRISNKGCFAVLITCVWLAASQQILLEGLLNGLSIFLLSLLLFRFRWLAAGDGKLASALAVALPQSLLPIALWFTLLCGGVLAVIYLVKYRVINRIPRERELGLPYGIAISFGFYIPILTSYLG
ncbi:prepilin peptidase [Shewanella marinintestina]|uniref:A24 family peptidase n=1 Tax=Shewanella marinintestina TaxID=190305 RepID=UPI00200F66B5|nr:prepilin peptidase [Shewanella marinintestina]MCL1145371.1 prepilin peptidase [Shewanella marinintestina]